MGKSVPYPLQARKVVWTRNRYYVKSAGMIAVSGVALQKLSGGENYLTLFFFINTRQTTTKILTTTHSDFHEYQETSVCRNHVDLSLALTVVAFDDAQPMSPQPGGCDPFRESPFDVRSQQHVSAQGVAGDSISR